MSEAGIVAGRNAAWKLINKLGEGDAGEVYLVESLLEGKEAILKRPHRSAFPSEVIRQASQIDTEGKILRAMENLDLETRVGKVRAPALLDVSKTGSEFSERYFIVIEKASGFDLNSLARDVTMGTPETAEQAKKVQTATTNLFDQLVRREFVPKLLLARILSLMLTFILEVHRRMLNDEGLMHHGAIWNDIKPEHLFWDPGQSKLMLIDWGNGKFLQDDGTTKDRQSSANDDLRQFVQEMGRFLQNFHPGLYQELDWPEDAPGTASLDNSIDALSKRIDEVCLRELDSFQQIRQKEKDIIGLESPKAANLEYLGKLQDEILQFGEMPDYSGMETLALGLGTKLVSQGEFGQFSKVCKQSAILPLASAEKWRLLDEISLLALKEDEQHIEAIKQATVGGLVDDWPAALWSLAESFQSKAQPEWWSELSQNMRQLHYGIDPDLLPPYVALNRVLYVLQSKTNQQIGNLEDRAADEFNDAKQLIIYRQLIKIIKSEILPKWMDLEPEPPNAGLAYREFNLIIEDLGDLIPNARLALMKTLDQPSAQVQIVLEAWDRKEFDQARKGLRRILLWDPQRWRVITAERLIKQTPSWLEKLYRGPINGEALLDFTARIELDGRELRNRIGFAHWLDSILSTLQRLRRGARASELIAENPDLVMIMPWISRVGWETPIRPKTDKTDEPIKITRILVDTNNHSTIDGMQESRLGQAQGFLLGDPLDTWAPEARGSSARVFQGFLRNSEANLKQAAIKVMRRDRIEYALPLFEEEIVILNLMKDVPGLTGLLETGFIKLDRGLQLPPETTSVSGRDLRGEVQRYGLEKIQEYFEHIPGRISKGWLPYLALEKRNPDDNLMLMCDAGYTRGRFLRLEHALRITIQICEILNQAHQRNIVYRDHKILHFYWQELYNGIFIIDWNVAKYHPSGLSDEEKQFDLVQFGARALHHIFTGRPAPGALPMGPTRPEEIEAAAHSYKVNWTYDDQRLPFELKDLLERVLAGSYFEAGELQNDLLNAFTQIYGLPPDEVGNPNASIDA